MVPLGEVNQCLLWREKTVWTPSQGNLNLLMIHPSWGDQGCIISSDVCFFTLNNHSNTNYSLVILPLMEHSQPYLFSHYNWQHGNTSGYYYIDPQTNIIMLCGRPFSRRPLHAVCVVVAPSFLVIIVLPIPGTFVPFDDVVVTVVTPPCRSSLSKVKKNGWTISARVKYIDRVPYFH